MARLPRIVGTVEVGRAIGLGVDDFSLLCRNGKVIYANGKWSLKTPFESADRINPMSFHKPIILPQPFSPTDAQIKAAKYGLTATTFTAAMSGLDFNVVGRAAWTYSPPTGGASAPYRISDFSYYLPEAKPPIKPPLEVLWNIADGGACPVINIPYRYNATIIYLGGETVDEFAKMEIEAEPMLGANADKYYMCVIAHDTDEEPNMFVANAFDSMAKFNEGSATDAGVIDPKPFSLYKVLRNTNDKVNFTYGLRHRMIPALNYIASRDLGYVMTLDTINGKTSGNFDSNWNATHYNGVNTGTFFNMPTLDYVDFYSYYLLGWMYNVRDVITVNIATTILSGGYKTISLQPNILNTIDDSDEELVEANYAGFVDLAFKAAISVRGGRIVIGNKTITKDASESVTIDLLSGASTMTYLIMYEDLNGHGGAVNYSMPKGYAWKNYNNVVLYTSTPSPKMAHNNEREIFDSSGAFIAYIESVTDIDNFVYNGVTYTRYIAGDIEKFNPISADGSRFGMYVEGAYPVYDDSLTFAGNSYSIVNFRLRGYPVTPPFGLADRDTKYLFDFVYNGIPASPLPERDIYRYRRESEI